MDVRGLTARCRRVRGAVSRISIGVKSTYAVIIRCAGCQPGVAVNYRVRRRRLYTGPIRIIQRALDYKSAFVAGIVRPRKIDRTGRDV